MTTMWDSLFSGSAEGSKPRLHASVATARSSRFRPAEWKSQRDAEFERDMKEHEAKALQGSGSWFANLFCFPLEHSDGAELQIHHNSNDFDHLTASDVDGVSVYASPSAEESLFDSLMHFGNTSIPASSSVAQDDENGERKSTQTRSMARGSTLTGLTGLTRTTGTRASVAGAPSLITPAGELDAIEEQREQLDLFGHRPEQQGFRTSLIARALAMNPRG